MGLFCVLLSMGLFCVLLSMGLFCVLFFDGPVEKCVMPHFFFSVWGMSYDG
jgi:hypothetical protein